MDESSLDLSNLEAVGTVLKNGSGLRSIVVLEILETIDLAKRIYEWLVHTDRMKMK